jgi:hypothetical protein
MYSTMKDRFVLKINFVQNLRVMRYNSFYLFRPVFFLHSKVYFCYFSLRPRTVSNYIHNVCPVVRINSLGCQMQLNCIFRATKQAIHKTDCFIDCMFVGLIDTEWIVIPWRNWETSRDRIFKLIRSPGIGSKVSMPPAM